MRYTNTAEALEALWAKCQAGPHKISTPFIMLWTLTHPALLKNDRITGAVSPYPAGVSREACRYGQIGINYERCTNNRMLKMDLLEMGADGEPEWFIAEELWYGKGRKVKDDPFLVYHIDTMKRYLCFKPREKTPGGKIMIGYDKWRDLSTGQEISVPSASLMKDKPRLRPGKIPWRTIALDSIFAFECGELFETIQFAA